MSTQKQKFELFSRLQALGFTYEESVALRRIEMTLHRWAEAECNGEIERDEKTGRPMRAHYPTLGSARRGEPVKYPIADREAGALKRLKAIIARRNEVHGEEPETGGSFIAPYHQTDPRGCALYLVKRSDIPSDFLMVCELADGYSVKRMQRDSEPYGMRFKTVVDAEQFKLSETLSAFYSHGLAVCA